MTQEQYNSMVEMLILATQNRNLNWTELDGDFKANIGGCSILLSSDYDYTVNISTFYLKMFNNEDIEFESYSFSKDLNANEYQQLERLYKTIRDVLYKITESENIILKKLQEMSTSSLSSDNELPF